MRMMMMLMMMMGGDGNNVLRMVMRTVEMAYEADAASLLFILPWFIIVL